jgi:hypothetical protein
MLGFWCYLYSTNHCSVTLLLRVVHTCNHLSHSSVLPLLALFRALRTFSPWLAIVIESPDLRALECSLLPLYLLLAVFPGAFTPRSGGGRSNIRAVRLITWSQSSSSLPLGLSLWQITPYILLPDGMLIMSVAVAYELATILVCSCPTLFFAALSPTIVIFYLWTYLEDFIVWSTTCAPSLASLIHVCTSSTTNYIVKMYVFSPSTISFGYLSLLAYSRLPCPIPTSYDCQYHYPTLIYQRRCHGVISNQRISGSTFRKTAHTSREKVVCPQESECVIVVVGPSQTSSLVLHPWLFSYTHIHKMTAPCLLYTPYPIHCSHDVCGKMPAFSESHARSQTLR